MLDLENNEFYKVQHRFKDLPALYQHVNKHFQVSYGRASLKNFPQQPFGFGRKFTAIPSALLSGVFKTTVHAIFAGFSVLPLAFGNPRPLAKNVLFIGYDLLESSGHLTTLIHDRFGRFVTEWCGFEKKCLNIWANKLECPVKPPVPQENTPEKAKKFDQVKPIPQDSQIPLPELPKVIDSPPSNKPEDYSNIKFSELSLEEMRNLLNKAGREEIIKQVSTDEIVEAIHKHADGFDFRFIRSLEERHLKKIRISEMLDKEINYLLWGFGDEEAKARQFSQEELLKWITTKKSQNCFLYVKLLNALEPDSIKKLNINELPYDAWAGWANNANPPAMNLFKHIAPSQIQEALEKKRFRDYQYELITVDQMKELDFTKFPVTMKLLIFPIYRTDLQEIFSQLQPDQKDHLIRVYKRLKIL